ncbi:amidohydrolase family protein [Vineibacter terrae]|uniref:Amidohydrolase family protein n=1 Tax=Vineibacter terrae TaxID=2586908 RepID=A0A5C8PF03_9HYPH|nr:amidohydrolase family protein [Vineibacter terrae]TXL72355.1 amidohydrolase family protein [Vineibacter terrae]
MSNHRLIIRGGTVVDGTGAEPRIADVEIVDGRIASVGAASGRGDEEVDARGLLVTPGFVDIHTHYDGQVTWSHQVTPSSAHGVTTALMGNCGVGFAPCRPTERDMLIRLMEGVEDIPGVVLNEGLPWNWESFPDFLDALSTRRYDIDVAAQVPHAALRVYVMGERGANREPATAEDRRLMARLAAEGVQAGAIGFSTSRTLAHRTSDGQPTPTLNAAEAELMEIAVAIGKTGRGVLQVITDHPGDDGEFALLRRLAESSGRPMSISLAQADRAPGKWRRALDLIRRAVDDGLEIRAQVCGRAVGLLYGIELSMNPFCTHPSWAAIADLPLAGKVAALRDPQMRRRLLDEEPGDPALRDRLFNFEKLFPLRDPPDYEPAPDASIAALAARAGRRPADLAYDLLLERDGRAILYRPLLNYATGALDECREMLQHRDTIIGLGDGGAHCGIICDASLPTFMLTHWTRDRRRGPRLSLPDVVRAQSRDTALAVGLTDRGLIAPGYKADINVIDHDRLRLHAPEIVYDLPSGGRRLIQRSEGYRATIVSGTITTRDDQPTGALPGRLVRGGAAVVA